jgi:starvation-inducible outer membrane lipoprotein
MLNTHLPLSSMLNPLFVFSLLEIKHLFTYLFCIYYSLCFYLGGTAGVPRRLCEGRSVAHRSQLSSHHVDPRAPTQLVRIGGKDLLFF